MERGLGRKQKQKWRRMQQEHHLRGFFKRFMNHSSANYPLATDGGGRGGETRRRQGLRGEKIRKSGGSSVTPYVFRRRPSLPSLPNLLSLTPALPPIPASRKSHPHQRITNPRPNCPPAPVATRRHGCHCDRERIRCRRAWRVAARRAN